VSPVAYVVFAAAFVAFALFMLVGFIRTRSQGAEQAVRRLHHFLAKSTARKGIAEISPTAMHPLSIEMIKESAALDGYVFVDVFNRNGVEYLRFRAERTKRQTVGGAHV
jgi:hypothetical protein